LIKPYDFDIDIDRSLCQYQKYGVISMKLTAAQCRAARGLIGWSQQQLATASKVAKPTIANFEAGKSTPYERTANDLVAALERAGVEFTNGIEPGVKIRRFRVGDSVQHRPQSPSRRVPLDNPDEIGKVVDVEPTASAPGPGYQMKVRFEWNEVQGYNHDFAFAGKVPAISRR
jgi:transcriptional regulator with XRE-family HTH domain